ncbi:MAG: radical SAM protein [Bacteroidales bacterium]|jgi:radical SAM protein with 4Fe4S-binding SPASM domain|nr:radical SAM protein [Bacteroidales bacterium]
MKYPFLEKRNIFVIPVGDYFSNSPEACFLVYSPLGNIFFLALPSQVEKLETQAMYNETDKLLDVLSNYSPLEERNPYGVSYDATSTFYILLNEKCNFHCKYCYSAEGRSNEELSIEQIYTALKYFLSSERNAPKTKTIMFMGGGEPTLSWHLVEQATLFAEKQALENNIILKKQLSTNGSVLTQQMLDFYKSHNFELQFSFDVIPEVQNEQRGQFDKVSTNLKRLGEEGVKCRIRSTVTNLNVERMMEMVELCHGEYPNVKHLTCEHVVDPDFFSTTEIVTNFYNQYFDSFIEARTSADKYNIELFSTSSGTIRALRDRFCFNLYCITPYGSLTTCPNISSPNEKGYEDAVFGQVNNNEIVFNDKSYKRLTDGNISTYPDCKECWAKWNCGGGCPNQRRVYEPHIFNEICVFMKRMLRHNLIHELAEKHKKTTGKNFFEDITNTLKKQ